MQAIRGSEPHTKADLSPIEAAVLESVAYSDIFDFPVTIEEIRRFLSVPASLDDVSRSRSAERSDFMQPSKLPNADSEKPGKMEKSGEIGQEGEIAAALQNLQPRLSSTAGYWHLQGREHLVALRRARAVESAALMKQARLYGSLVGKLPFVRMVAVTGSLAVDNAGAGDDIDFVIVTAPKRVWTARAFTMLVVRAAALRGFTLCPNYLLSEDVLSLDDRDFYTARELLQMRPVAGEATHKAMLAQNAWIRDLLPNHQPEAPLEASKTRPWLKSLLEAPLRSLLGDLLESWVYRRKAAELRRQAAGNGEAVFDQTMCKGHFEGHRQRTREALARRLQELRA